MSQSKWNTQISFSEGKICWPFLSTPEPKERNDTHTKMIIYTSKNEDPDQDNRLHISDRMSPLQGHVPRSTTNKEKSKE